MKEEGKAQMKLRRLLKRCKKDGHLLNKLKKAAMASLFKYILGKQVVRLFLWGECEKYFTKLHLRLNTFLLAIIQCGHIIQRSHDNVTTYHMLMNNLVE